MTFEYEKVVMDEKMQEVWIRRNLNTDRQGEFESSIKAFLREQAS
jgi:hypothetical protein